MSNPAFAGGIWDNGSHLNPTSLTRRLVFSADTTISKAAHHQSILQICYRQPQTVCPCIMAKSLPTTAPDRGFSNKMSLQYHRDRSLNVQMQTSSCAYCKRSHIRCYSVAAVTLGVSPVAVNGLVGPQHDDVMSTCFHMLRRAELLEQKSR